VTRAGRTNSAQELERRVSSHSIGTPMSASNLRAARRSDFTNVSRRDDGSLKKRPRLATEPSSVVVTTWSRRVRRAVLSRADANVNSDGARRVGAAIAFGRAKGVAGSRCSATSNAPVGVRNLHGGFRAGWNRGAGNGVCYRGNRHWFSCANGRGFHASDVTPLPRGNSQLEYLRCWRLLWSRTLIWAHRSASAELALGREESILPGPKK
jgi:hypothetical protein